jgi:hypothetical protein
MTPLNTLDRYLDTLEDIGIITISCGYDIFRASLNKNLNSFIGKLWTTENTFMP